MAELCEIRGLSIAYTLRDGTRIRALDDLNLSIVSGEIVGILGESGCGKSTMASAILRLLPAHADRDQGAILFRGLDLFTLPESELREIRGRQISLIPQDPVLALNPVISVGVQIEEVLRAHLPLRPKERRSRVWSCWAKSVSITRKRFTAPTHIS